MPTKPGSFSPPTPSGTDASRPFEPVADAGPTFDPTALWAGVVALVASIFQFLLFVGAFGALNQGRVDRPHVALLGQGSVAAGVLALGLAAYAAYRRRAHVAWSVGAAAVGFVIGAFFASQVPESFGFLGAIGWLYFETVLLVLLVAPFVVFVVFVVSERRTLGWGIGLGIVVLHASAYLILVAYILANLERLARRAEEANAASLAAVATVGALVVAAWLRRRDV